MLGSKKSLPLMQIIIAAIFATIIKNVLKSNISYLNNVNFIVDLILFSVIFIPIMYFLFPRIKRLLGQNKG
ncbi:hypothetical protein SOPP22_11385 [Shewanella sp. OPT22]|nr:hypothetical protein SOPP22_11385 [Shewanella sp. OPT22]